MPEDYEKISPTAVLVAFMRARYTDMPYAREIYSAARQMTKPYFFKKTPLDFSQAGKICTQHHGPAGLSRGQISIAQ
jgi:hypothetical protein